VKGKTEWSVVEAKNIREKFSLPFPHKIIMEELLWVVSHEYTLIKSTRENNSTPARAQHFTEDEARERRMKKYDTTRKSINTSERNE
jgi:hypothetical protein